MFLVQEGQCATSKFIPVVLIKGMVCVSGSGGLLPGSKNMLAFCIFMRKKSISQNQFSNPIYLETSNKLLITKSPYLHERREFKK